MSARKILLFGSTGCFGTEFANACADENVELIGLSHADIDITDTDAVNRAVSQHAPDTVVNAVAIVDMNYCEDNPAHAFDVHAGAAMNIAKTCAERDITYVHTSTHAVFDGLKTGGYDEDDEANPRNVYAASKYAGELLVKNLAPQSYIVRFPTMFGRRQNNSPGFVDKLITWLHEDRVLRIADDKIDTPTFAYDTSQAVLGLLEKNEPYGLYHLANEGAVSFFDFAVRVRDLLGRNNVIERAKDADFPSKGLKSLNTALLSKKIDALRPWPEALEDYLENQCA